MKYPIILFLLIFSLPTFSEAVQIDTVAYVYELGGDKSFDFSGGSNHSCGTNIYRVYSTTTDSINRKFSLILSAFMANKKLLINMEACDGNRLKVGWVRLIN